MNRSRTAIFNAKYEVLIYWSDEDKAVIVEVPELAGCMADGQTPAKALKNIQIIIKEWIDTAKEEGLEIPQPKGRRLAFA